MGELRALAKLMQAQKPLSQPGASAERSRKLMALVSAGNDQQYLTFVREGIQVPAELKRQRELEGTGLHGGKSSVFPVGGRSSQAGNNLGVGHWL